MRLRRLLQPIANGVGHAFRLLPPGARFGAARRLALALAPLLRASPYYRRRPSSLDGAREEALRILLRTMTRARVEFDVDVELDGDQFVPAGPLVLVSAHFLLNVVVTRWAHDRGRGFTPVLGTLRETIYHLGTRAPVRPIYSGPQVLLQARERLDAEGIVFCNLDNTEPGERTLRVDTAGGVRHVSGAMLRFAARRATPVVFTACHFDPRGRVVLRFVPLPGDPDAALATYVDLFRQHAAAIHR